jgi:hypothetical protein
MTAFAASPQEAALQSTAATTIRRTNIAGDLATVYVADGTVEGARVDVPVLVERFPFGWQPIDILEDPCDILQRRVPSARVAALMRGMPSGTRACRPDATSTLDVGPRRDVEAIRYRMRGPFVRTVVVSGAFARGEWYGAGGGEEFFKRSGSRWIRIGGGGGALGARDLRRLGVPLSAICAFHTYDAKCPRVAR